MNVRVTQEQPGGREPAPDKLLVVQTFVNTLDIEGGTDELTTPAALAKWIYTTGLIEGHVRAGVRDLTRAVQLREALRTLLYANNGGELDHRTRRVLDQAAVSARFTVRFGASRPHARLESTASGAAGALGAVMASVFTAIQDGTLYRLKACRRDACRWVFYDHSNARSGVWCSMSICGNRTKVIRHRSTSK